MTFYQVATEWHNMHQIGLGTSTAHGYLYNLKHVFPFIGQEEINSIKYNHLQCILNAKAAEGYSKRTVTGIRRTIIMVFDHALKSEYVNKSPAVFTSIPHISQPKQDRCISVIEAEIIQGFKHKYQLFVSTLLFTGMRRGEALALTWGDINFSSSIITISKAVEFDGNKTIVKSPKTANSYRIIPIPSPLKRQLVKANTGTSNGFVFTQLTTGMLHTQSSYKKMWQNWQKDFNTYYTRKVGSSPQHITSHMLRHYYITYLFENGIPDIIIQSVAGHADIAFTRSRYTHIRKHFQAQCYENIMNLYV